VTSNFKIFLGGMPPESLETGMACFACHIYSTLHLKISSLFMEKNHPTKNPSYGPEIGRSLGSGISF